MPNEYLTPTQRWVRDVTRSGETWLDAAGAAADLAGFGFPVRFLDFESVVLAVPVWKGRRPYEQIPFQFSLHRREEDGTLHHEAFLDLSGEDPAGPLARALVGGCGESGPVFAYNATFEKWSSAPSRSVFPGIAALSSPTLIASSIYSPSRKPASTILPSTVDGG